MYIVYNYAAETTCGIMVVCDKYLHTSIHVYIFYIVYDIVGKSSKTGNKRGRVYDASSDDKTQTCACMCIYYICVCVFVYIYSCVCTIRVLYVSVQKIIQLWQRNSSLKMCLVVAVHTARPRSRGQNTIAYDSPFREHDCVHCGLSICTAYDKMKMN